MKLLENVDLKQMRVDYEILSCLNNSETPIGATKLVHIIGDRLSMSQASIGRQLMRFDVMGLTRLHGRKGRALTTLGKQRLNELKREFVLRARNSSLLAALNTNDEKNLIDVLISRRAIERENAYLVALHASTEELEFLRNLIDRQDRSLASGVIPAEEDEQFHMAIARMSRNRVLYHALRLVWDEGMLPHVTSNIRYSVGSQLVVDHLKIYECIADRDPDAASAAMTQHINQIIEDVKKYFILKGAGKKSNIE